MVLLALPFLAAAMQTLVPILPGRFQTATIVVLALVLIGPLAGQRRFLSTVRQVAPLDEMIAQYKPRGGWSSDDVLVTRSVAFTHAMTEAPNIVERCSAQQAEDFAHRPGVHAHYLRSWGDGGPTRLKSLCASAVLSAGRSPDNRGPWLYDYGYCPLFQQLGR
jgi:hypothetical protein